MLPNITNGTFGNGTNFQNENVFGHDVSVASYVVLVLGLIVGIGVIYCMACGPLSPLVKCCTEVTHDCYKGVKSCCTKKRGRDAAPILPMRNQDIAQAPPAYVAGPAAALEGDDHRDTVALVVKPD